jgi:uncharacterized membrane protein
MTIDISCSVFCVCMCVCMYVCVHGYSYYGYSVSRRLGTQLFSVLVLLLLLLLLSVFVYKVSQRDTLGLTAAKMRNGIYNIPRNRTTFTGALRPIKSERAQL